MDVIVVLGGLALLLLLAVLTGLSVDVDRRARSRAWRNIATSRRDNWEQARDLREAITWTRCVDCPFGRYEANVLDD